MKQTNASPSSKPVLWMLLGLVIGLAAATLLSLTPLGEHARSVFDTTRPSVQGGGPAEQLWTCPMHPQVIQDHPGSCPICGMDLVPVEAAQVKPADNGSATAEAAHPWTCPMHPQVIQDHPGSCPICGMDLVPLETGEVEQGHEDHAVHAERQGAMVRIDPTVVQNMNVTTEPVARHDITRRIRTVGYLDYDQDRMVTITTKYPGFVERVYVNYVGQPISAGDPLFDVYAPELVQTQQELLSAIRYAGQMGDAPADTRARADALVAAARQRLDYWDITEDQIDRLISTGEIARTLTVTAPSSGVAMKVLHGLQGARIEPGMDVIHIAGLQTLWLNVELFEGQLPWVTVGTPATVTLTYLPGETFRGHIRFIKPEVDERTRTVQLTLEVPNPRGRLRVGMYATVLFEPVAVRGALTVPSQAVLRTGQRDLVVVALGDGRFAPREVALGAEGDGVVQVLDGLSAGDVVVTSAQFLIDSESNLREAISKMTGEARPDPGHGH